MTVTTQPTDLRTHARYQLAVDSRIPVSVEWTSDDQSHQCDACLTDLSASGARLRLSQKVPLHETIEVRLRVGKLAIDFHCAAEVCWLQPRDGQWVLGCAFECELPEQVLSQLAGNGYLNRRANPRIPIELAVEVKEELGTSQWFEATVDNYSSGGFRLQSKTPVAVGQRVLVQMEDADRRQRTVPGRAHWRADSDDGYAVGCSFLNGEGFQKLAAVVGSKTTRREKKGRRSMNLSPLAWLALVSVFFVVSQQETLVASMKLLWQLFR